MHKHLAAGRAQVGSTCAGRHRPQSLDTSQCAACASCGES